MHSKTRQPPPDPFNQMDPKSYAKSKLTGKKKKASSPNTKSKPTTKSSNNTNNTNNTNQSRTSAPLETTHYHPRSHLHSVIAPEFPFLVAESEQINKSQPVDQQKLYSKRSKSAKSQSTYQQRGQILLLSDEQRLAQFESKFTEKNPQVNNRGFYDHEDDESTGGSFVYQNTPGEPIYQMGGADFSHMMDRQLQQTYQHRMASANLDDQSEEALLNIVNVMMDASPPRQNSAGSSSTSSINRHTRSSMSSGSSRNSSSRSAKGLEEQLARKRPSSNKVSNGNKKTGRRGRPSSSTLASNTTTTASTASSTFAQKKKRRPHTSHGSREQDNPKSSYNAARNAIQLMEAPGASSSSSSSQRIHGRSPSASSHRSEFDRPVSTGGYGSAEEYYNQSNDDEDDDDDDDDWVRVL
eukprot:TRINITY_DN5344_c0_g1_i2.p1 TRINITY_DN5344_c0_g1~~TRINITY_DN5344_c0_g1_i2.p1  ORF type:complete len:437 (-),score=103.04 TRINITY_DN5344_c0_g1_i2:363-1592(-)